MRVVTQELGTATILAPIGRISIGSGDDILRHAIDQAVQNGSRNLILDLEAVSKMDSSALGELIAAQSRMARIGGRLKLVNVPPRIMIVINEAHLGSFLQAHAPCCSSS